MTRNIIYHRPATVEEALALLSRPDQHNALLAGGTRLNAALKELEIDALVDLQAAGLDQIEVGDGEITFGAMVTLQNVVDSPATGHFWRRMAYQEAANTFRHMATIGGTVAAAEPDSELLAALLVSEARVALVSNRGRRDVPLADYLARRPISGELEIITQVTAAVGGRTAHERVARTPRDRPIVAAVARQNPAGRRLLALSGMAVVPILVQADQIEQLDPPADFRGSSAYRRSMATILAGRVLNQLDHSQGEE